MESEEILGLQFRVHCSTCSSISGKRFLITHPTTKQLYTEMVYQPMLELLAYLRANGFKTFIKDGNDFSTNIQTRRRSK